MSVYEQLKTKKSKYLIALSLIGWVSILLVLIGFWTNNGTALASGILIGFSMQVATQIRRLLARKKLLRAGEKAVEEAVENASNEV